MVWYKWHVWVECSFILGVLSRHESLSSLGGGKSNYCVKEIREVEHDANQNYKHVKLSTNKLNQYKQKEDMKMKTKVNI